MKKIMAILGAGMLSVFGAFVLASPAAALPQDECRTVVSNLTERPDNGSGGVWAMDALTRTAVVCVATPEVAAKATVPVEAQAYTAKVTDVGTFVTLGGPNLSPAAKVALKAGVTGTVKGSFEFAFIAPAKWAGFDASQMLDVKGTEPTTGNWIKAMWSAGGYEGKLLDNWKWFYKTCNELWVEAATGMKGDITGKVPCPSASPTPSTSASGTPTASASASTVPVGNQLPLTGAGLPALLVVGLGALVVGVGAIIIGRRRRPKFEA